MSCILCPSTFFLQAVRWIAIRNYLNIVRQVLGVREYWIVDSTKELVMVYRFENEIMEEYSFSEDIPVGIYEDFSIRIS